MGVKTKRHLEDLAIKYEHFVKDNGNKDVLAGSFRAISTEEETFGNGVKLGIVYGYVHSAIKHLLDKDELGEERAKCAQEALDALLKERSFQCVVDALNILADGRILY